MKTEWDYTTLAAAYLKRPGYAEEAIDRMLRVSGVKEGDAVCDVGAGAAHLTKLLAKRGLQVTAVEPNDAMRANGVAETAAFKNVVWFEGVGEDTKQRDSSFRLVTFGSSFNVTDRRQALEESFRILAPGGWFACLWNHRQLDDPIQKEIEGIIRRHIANYDYGSRREDQTAVIAESGRFDHIQEFSGEVTHQLPKEDVVEAWRSHGTLHRQAGPMFDQIIREIEEMLRGLDGETVAVPYVTRGWMAKSVKTGL